MFPGLWAVNGVSNINNISRTPPLLMQGPSPLESSSNILCGSVTKGQFLTYLNPQLSRYESAAALLYPCLHKKPHLGQKSLPLPTKPIATTSMLHQAPWQVDLWGAKITWWLVRKERYSHRKLFGVEQRAWAGSVQLEDPGEGKLCGSLLPRV